MQKKSDLNFKITMPKNVIKHQVLDVDGSQPLVQVAIKKLCNQNVAMAALACSEKFFSASDIGQSQKSLMHLEYLNKCGKVDVSRFVDPQKFSLRHQLGKTARLRAAVMAA